MSLLYMTYCNPNQTTVIRDRDDLISVVGF